MDISARQKVQERFQALNKGIQRHLQQAAKGLKFRGIPRFQFRLSSQAGWVTEEDRLLAIAFITRLSNIPVFREVVAIQTNSEIQFANYNQATQAINEFRPIIQNRKDDIHFKKIHRFASRIFENRDSTKGLVVIITDGTDKEVTDDWVHNLGQSTKFINRLLEGLDFDYVYNGILQHSDKRFRERYADDYRSGEMQYVIIKHALLLENIQQSLWNHLLSLNLGLVSGSTKGGLA